jgi:hemoglobin-like flavoprotein
MDIHDSVHQVLEQKDSFATVFYSVFFENHSEARQHFTQVNFKHQNALLTMALLVMERHYRFNYPATEMYLNYLGTKHDERGISPEMYPPFREALLTSLQRFHGPAWDNQLAA